MGKIRIDSIKWIGFLQRSLRDWRNIVFFTVPCDSLEVLKAAAKHRSCSWTAADDDVAGDDDSFITIGKMQGVLVAGVEDVVGEYHAFSRIPGTATECVTGIDDRVVDDLQIQRLALMIGTRKARARSADEHVIANDGLALHLHGAIAATAAEIALDNVYRFASGAIDGDARILRIMDIVFRDEIAPRALFHLDAVSMRAAAIVDVIQCDHAFAHDVLAMVRAKVHPFAVSTAMVYVIASQKEMARVRAVSAETNCTGVMNVTLVNPHLAALPKP